MVRETLNRDSTELQEYLKEVQRLFQGSFKGVLWEFLEGLKNVSVFQGNFKKVSRVFKECLKFSYKKFRKGLLGVSRMFLQSFVLQFCCCMALIEATGAEGGLVEIRSYLPLVFLKHSMF